MLKPLYTTAGRILIYPDPQQSSAPLDSLTKREALAFLTELAKVLNAATPSDSKMD